MFVLGSVTLSKSEVMLLSGISYLANIPDESSFAGYCKLISDMIHDVCYLVKDLSPANFNTSRVKFDKTSFSQEGLEHSHNVITTSEDRTSFVFAHAEYRVYITVRRVVRFYNSGPNLNTISTMMK